ncbi:hypothetical protein [Brevibacillus nitrificans]|uniref:hypothetical protein n=1 Tax=Brevibacillus nitrificans TaxID=651560 RepID=UPI002633FB7D|nr:hypothetical protein [Brevibacillus nitrificans]
MERLKYSTEEELVDTFITRLNEQNDPMTVTMREVDCWQGRADVVKAYIKNSDANLGLDQASLLKQLTCSNIIAQLHKKAPRTQGYVRSRVGITQETFSKWLRELKKAQIVQETETGSLLLSENFSIPDLEFWAYECKLSNWKRALYQANQYKGFSHFTFVVMPDDHIKPAVKNIDAFKATNIGLIKVDFSGEYEIIHKPTKSNPRRKAFNIVGVGIAMAHLLTH